MSVFEGGAGMATSDGVTLHASSSYAEGSAEEVVRGDGGGVLSETTAW